MPDLKSEIRQRHLISLVLIIAEILFCLTQLSVRLRGHWPSCPLTTQGALILQKIIKLLMDKATSKNLSMPALICFQSLDIIIDQGYLKSRKCGR